VPTVTLLIPIHDPNQEHETLVHAALYSVSQQTRQPDEILLVANHDIGYFNTIQDSFSEILNLRFLKSDAQSAPENINFGVKYAKGKFIRLLFQDDQLSNSESLNQSISLLESSEFKWSVIGSAGIDLISGEIFPRVTPVFSEELSLGINSIGAPSVVCFEKDFYIPMNKDLKYMFDCDWYLRMAHRFGPPLEVQEVGVNIGIHQAQATNWAKNLAKIENRIVKKHHRKRIFAKHCSCVLSK
jgi:glycosyltransferase involved in cell wall biosynthesis